MLAGLFGGRAQNPQPAVLPGHHKCNGARQAKANRRQDPTLLLFREEVDDASRAEPGVGKSALHRRVSVRNAAYRLAGGMMPFMRA